MEKNSYNYNNEQFIMLISTFICIELSRGRTTNEIDLLAIILQNVSTQLASIADIRVLSQDDNENNILPLI